MAEKNVIAEHAEIIGSDGIHVGTVDHMQDGKIKLTKREGEDHLRYLSTAHVADIKGSTVTLTVSADEAISSETAE